MWTKAEAERVEAALRAYEPRDPRVSVAVEGGFDRPPLEPTPAAQALYERAKAIAAELGFDLPAARVGGASDGNLTAAAGVPTLDGLGPVGDGAHARHEWVLTYAFIALLVVPVLTIGLWRSPDASLPAPPA